MNKVFLTGIIAEPPIMITPLNRKPRTLFHLCVSHRTREGRVKRELYPINAWDNLAQWAYQNLRQGQRISLQGYLTQQLTVGTAYPADVEVTASEFFADSDRMNFW